MKASDPFSSTKDATQKTNRADKHVVEEGPDASDIFARKESSMSEVKD